MRVVYYWPAADDQLYTPYAYGKAEREVLTQLQIRQLAKIVKEWNDG